MWWLSDFFCHFLQSQRKANTHFVVKIQLYFRKWKSSPGLSLSVLCTVSFASLETEKTQKPVRMNVCHRSIDANMPKHNFTFNKTVIVLHGNLERVRRKWPLTCVRSKPPIWKESPLFYPTGTSSFERPVTSLGSGTFLANQKEPAMKFKLVCTRDGAVPVVGWSLFKCGGELFRLDKNITIVIVTIGSAFLSLSFFFSLTRITCTSTSVIKQLFLNCFCLNWMSVCSDLISMLNRW